MMFVWAASYAEIQCGRIGYLRIVFLPKHPILKITMSKVLVRALRLIAFGIILSLHAGCNCKGPWPVAGVSVQYPNLTTPSELQAILFVRDDFAHVIDTITLGTLGEDNGFRALIDFEATGFGELPPDYIIFVDNTTHTDTISDISFRRKDGCKARIVDFTYQFNGEVRTDSRVTIE